MTCSPPTKRSNSHIWYSNLTAMTRLVKTYNPNHVFVDTNVLIGAYSGDARYQTDSDCLHYLYSIVGKRFYISTLSVAQLISVYQKHKTNEEIRVSFASCSIASPSSTSR